MNITRTPRLTWLSGPSKTGEDPRRIMGLCENAGQGLECRWPSQWPDGYAFQETGSMSPWLQWDKLQLTLCPAPLGSVVGRRMVDLFHWLREVCISQQVPAQARKFLNCNRRGCSWDWGPKGLLWDGAWWAYQVGSDRHMSPSRFLHRLDSSLTVRGGARANTGLPWDLLWDRCKKAQSQLRGVQSTQQVPAHFK